MLNFNVRKLLCPYSILMLAFSDDAEVRLPIYYKIARNFPLDVYFLNDPSYTMRFLIQRLNELANSIGNYFYNKYKFIIKI